MVIKLYSIIIAQFLYLLKSLKYSKGLFLIRSIIILHPTIYIMTGNMGSDKKHSSQRAALELIDRINHELDLGNTPINIYIDLTKAFDTIDHNISISKIQHYGIKGAALQLLLSYL